MKHFTNILIYVLYDGIQNSVFHGQVLTPLLKKLAQKKTRKVVIISFEKNNAFVKNYKHYITQKNQKRLKIITLKKYPFLGRFSLISAIYRLKNVLKQYNEYSIVARGPIAGYLCSKVINFGRCKSFTIQARGLIAQEYKYAHKHEKNPVLHLVHTIRYYQYQSLEKTLYKTSINFPRTHIEAVSKALKTYLATQFGTYEKNITIAKHDIPQILDKKQILLYRQEIRKNLHIPTNKVVYCYNGSAKPWQCPDKVVAFFSTQLKKDKYSFLLILTQDTKQFEKVIKTYDLPQPVYHLQKVKHDDIYTYLCACDYGIIFREKHIINWVSRPTKILEYRAAGLTIIHNNTIGFLNDSC